MNILTDEFPTKIRIKEEIYNINTDFRNCLNIMLAYEDKNLTLEEKTEIMLELLYGKEVLELDRESIEIAIKKAIFFLDCGEVEDIQNQNSKRTYSFSKDAKYIYSSIKQSYPGIDIKKIQYMHWWEFVYLFLGLNKDSFFSHMICLRDKKNKGKLTKEEKELYINMIDILELEQESNYTEEEQKQVDKFMNLLNGGN